MSQYSLELEKTMKIDEVAESLAVSSATVRNWIKTGYLKTLSSGGLVSVESFEELRSTVIGSIKLTSRANKSMKDEHNHSDLAEAVRDMLASEGLAIEKVGAFYESSLSDSYRNKEGIYYTPQEIVDEFFDLLECDCSELTFCDPCCGSGNFIEGALKKGFKPENIYGFDVDSTAIEVAESRVKALTGGKNANFKVVNFLEEAKNIEDRFDVIFTNPPWGKKLLAAEKASYAKKYGSGNSKDTTAFFFFASLQILERNGILGFLVQDALFNIKTFESVREKALELRLEWLRDFGKPFKGLLTKAKGIALRNSPEISDSVNCVGLDSQFKRSQIEFKKNPKSVFNLSCDPSESAVIELMLAQPHITLKGQAEYGLGIVTGNNKKFCKPEPESGYVPVYKGSDITPLGLKKPSAYIPRDLSLYQQVAPLRLYNAPKKLIYKFISSRLAFYCDDKQSLVLNSANVIVLSDQFPVPTEVVARYFNSKLLNWFFAKLFETHKVLQADLECLPIYSEFLIKNPEFTESDLCQYLGIEESKNGTYRVKK